MPKLTDSLPSYRLHKGSGQARVTLDGKTFYLGKFDMPSSHEKYNRIVGEWLANGRRLPVEDSAPQTVSMLCLAYLLHAKAFYVKNGKVTDEVASIKVAIKYLRRLYGSVLVEAFSPLGLEAIQCEMVKDGHSRRYLNKNISRIKRMFKWGVSKEMVPVTVYQALATVPGLKKGKTDAIEKPPVLPVSDDVVEATLKHCNPVVEAMIRFQRLTGCRPGELFILRPCDIDRSESVWRYTPSSHKTEHHERSRVIFVGPQAQDVLRPFLLREDTDFCFRSQRGKQFTGERYRSLIHNACAKAFPPINDLKGAELKEWNKLNRWNPNQLRHTAATAIREQFDLEGAQVILGHASVDMTEVYAEVSHSKAAEIALAVG